MATTLTDATLLKNDNRRRRWIIHICLLSLFVLLLLLIVGFFLFSSSGMTADEASTAHAQLKSVFTRERAEQLLGKPHMVTTEADGIALHWSFITHSFASVDTFQCKLLCVGGDKFCVSDYGKLRIEGWSAWVFRWLQLKDKIGIK